MSHKKLKLIARIGLLLVLFLASLVVLANYLIQKPSFQQAFLRKISDLSGFNIKAERVGLDFRHGVGIFADQLDATSREEEAKITATRVRVVLRTSRLIRGQIEPTRIYLLRPDLKVAMGGKTVFSRAGGELPSELFALFWFPGLRFFSVQEGRIHVKELSYFLDHLNINIQADGSEKAALSLSSRGYIRHAKQKAFFRLRGSILQSTERHRFFPADMVLGLENVPVKWVQRSKRFELIKGNLKATLKIQGSQEGLLRVRGKVSVDSLRMQLLAPGRKETFSLPGLAIDFQSLLEARMIKVPSLTLSAPGMSLSANLDLDLKRKGNPHLSLRAKSEFMELSTFKRFSPTIFFPAWIEEKLFPLLRSGDVRLDLLSFKGSMAQLQNLGSTENQGLLALKFQCKNFDIYGQGVKKPFKSISGAVIWEGGIFKIAHLEGSFGRSFIRDAGLEAKGLGGEKPTFNAMMSGAFEISDLLNQTESELMPFALRSRIKAAGAISGHVDFKARFSYQSGWDLPQATEGIFNFKNCSVSKKKLFFPLILKNAEVQIRKGSLPLLKGRGTWGNTAFKVSSSFVAGKAGFGIKTAEISASLDPNELAFFLYPGFSWSFQNRMPCLVSVAREKDQWSLKGTIDLDTLALKAGYLFMSPPGKENSLSFEAAFLPHEELKVEKATLAFNNSILEASGSYNLRSPKKSAVKLSVPYLNIKDLGLRFSNGILLKQGIIKADLEANSYDGKLRTLLGKVQAADLSFGFEPLASSVNDCSFSLRFSGKKISITSLKMRIGKSVARIKGELEERQTLKGRISVAFPFFNAKDFSLRKRHLLEDQQTLSIQSIISIINRADIFIDLGILKGEWKKLVFGPVKVEANLKKGNLFIQKSSLNVDRCLFNITGHIKSNPEKEISFLSQVKLSGQPIEKLFQELEMEDKYLSGNLSMEALLYSKAKERRQLVSGLVGAANIEIKEGAIKKSNVLIRILDFLSLQKIFREAPPDISMQGFRFDSIKGHIAIENGVLRTEKMIMKSPVFNAVGAGKLDLVQGAVDLDLGTHPLGTLDALVSKVPVVGYILTGEGKSLLTYYFEVKGPMKNPDVQYIPFKNLGKGVAGVLKRLFLSPVRIFNDIGKAIKNIPTTEAPVIQESR